MKFLKINQKEGKNSRPIMGHVLCRNLAAREHKWQRSSSEGKITRVMVGRVGLFWWLMASGESNSRDLSCSSGDPTLRQSGMLTLNR